MILTRLMTLPLTLSALGKSSDYRSRDLDGRLCRAADYRGKWLVINLWTAWCAPCLQEMPGLERCYRQHGDIAQVWG